MPLMCHCRVGTSHKWERKHKRVNQQTISVVMGCVACSGIKTGDKWRPPSAFIPVIIAYTLRHTKTSSQHTTTQSKVDSQSGRTGDQPNELYKWTSSDNWSQPRRVTPFISAIASLWLCLVCLNCVVIIATSVILWRQRCCWVGGFVSFCLSIGRIVTLKPPHRKPIMTRTHYRVVENF